MTTITREQLIKKAQEQIAFCRDTKVTGEGRAHVDQCAALFEIALAAMDSEPVAEVLSNRPGNDTSTIDRALPVGTQLYRHAQQPVVPDAAAVYAQLSDHEKWSTSLENVNHVLNAFRAAMLNGGKP